MFKRAEALYKAEKYLEAAREFERLATQNPDQSFADKAFYNAATRTNANITIPQRVAPNAW